MTAATADVNRGVGELGVILESFIGVALAQGPAIMTPVGQIALVAAAVVAAVFLSNVPESLSASTGLKASGRSPRWSSGCGPW